MRPTRLKDFARGLKCRIVSAPAPLPLIFQNVGVHSSYVRDDVGIVPPIGATAPTFRTVSGSGAEAETIQNLGYGLQRILLTDRKGSQETIRFLAHLWVLSVRTESTPPEAGQADSTTNPTRHPPSAPLMPAIRTNERSRGEKGEIASVPNNRAFCRYVN